MGSWPNNNRAAYRSCLTPHDRQLLAGAYWPVIALAVPTITARVTRWRRHQQEAGIR